MGMFDLDRSRFSLVNTQVFTQTKMALLRWKSPAINLAMRRRCRGGRCKRLVIKISIEFGVDQIKEMW